MNEDPRSPQNPASHRPNDLSQIEHQLRQWQLPSVSWDAETILRAAAKQTQQTAPPREPSKPTANRRSAQWLVIGASWVGGTIVGSVLTFLMLNYHRAPVPDAAPDQHAAQTSDTRHNDSPSTPPSHPNKDVAERVEPTRRSDSSHRASEWSDFELLVSQQLLDAHRQPLASFEDAPLRAGKFSHLTAPAPSAQRPRSPIVSSEGSDMEPGDGTAADEEPAASRPLRRSVDREGLLQELLGTPQGSLL